MSAEKETSVAVDPAWCGPMPLDPAARVKPTPEEIEALGRLTKAHSDLQRLGWRDANYAPANTNLHLIEVGSTGIHKGYRDQGRLFWVYDGYEWPSRPCLYRIDPTPPSQEHATPSSTLAEPLQGAEAPSPKLQEDTAHHAAGTRGIGVGETVGSLPPVAPTNGDELK